MGKHGENVGKHGENPGKMMEDWGDFMEKPWKNGERSEKSKKFEDLNSRTSVNIDVFQENLGFHPRKTVMMVFHVKKHCVDVWYMNVTMVYSHGHDYRGG